MRRPLRLSVLTAAGALVAGTLTTLATVSGPAVAAPERQDRLEVYVGTVEQSDLPALLATGVDRSELQVRPAGGDGVRVEAILSGAQAQDLARQGLDLRAKRIEGRTVSERADAAAAEGWDVWRDYGEITAQLRKVARDNPGITKLVSIGESLDGTDIWAMKVTANARRTRDGARPSVLYLSAQHAREWITPEMTTRLLNYVVSTSRKPWMKRIIGESELWFLPVANPDGYDFTFTEGNRLWRKNLRDNNGDGEITPGDGVDLNRNWPYKWGYDNEGSSPEPASETFRGAGPASEPETRALDRFVGRVGFEFVNNYHSAAQLILYGVGWQVATPSPDDVITAAMAGTDRRPAVPGYDPDLSAELYTTNGETDGSLAEDHGVLGFTPEMTTCEVASASNPEDEWEPEDCGSGFEFPDDEALVQAEFRKNIPFALSLARSAAHPDRPVTSTGLKTGNFRTDPFTTSLGSPQPVAVIARTSLRQHRMKYRVDGGAVRTVPATRWRGGERYGAENNRYYAEYRGVVRGAGAGDRVTVWFTGSERRGKRSVAVASKRFTYRVASDIGGDVLVVANEDYTGVNPTYPEGTDAPKYADAHVAAIEAAGYDADVWDVDRQGVPHHLGALGHYDAVLWYLGDNRLTQDPEDESTTTPLGDLPDVSVAERAQYLTIAMRDYLNEGGKLIHTGETAQFEGLPGISDAVGGLYYGLGSAPSRPCVITADFFGDCQILADDFRQYWLGAFTRFSVDGPTGVQGTSAPIEGTEIGLGGPVVEGDNPLDEAGVFVPTSEVLPVADHPQFRSRGLGLYTVPPGGPFVPVEGERYAGFLHTDNAYERLTRTATVPAGAVSAQLQFQASWSTEPGYDNVIVEARTVGGEDWTTLPELGGATSTETPPECTTGGFLFEIHPFLQTYLGADCTNPDGDWNALTGDSEGWQPLAFDLGGFAGRDVELSISYVADGNTGGVGAFVDDTRIVIDGVTDADGFEGDTSAWAPGAPPADSPPVDADWQIGGPLVQNVAGTATDDTVLLGFGLEQVATEEQRNALVDAALEELLG